METRYTQYRVRGKTWEGNPYESVQSFTHNHHSELELDGGVPKTKAQALVDNWNRTTAMYEKRAVAEGKTYFRSTYELVEPAPAPKPDPLDGYVESTEAAFELVKYGQWTLNDFESWMAKMTGSAYDDGRKNGIDWCRELITPKE